MTLRLATFNVENMFKRPSIMNLPTWDDGKSVLEDYYKLSNLIQKQHYTDNDKSKMLSIMSQNQGLIANRESKYIILNDIRGKFLKKPRDEPPQIVADGRSDWIGWFELKTEVIKETASENTALVIKEVNADIMGLVEVENRTVLRQFNDTVIPKIGGQKYDHLMLIDGNDERGIDVGIITREPYAIESIVSHVDDTDSKGNIFSRDCTEYQIKISSDKTLLVLVNHFKSKGYGDQITSNEKRKRQAQRVADIYKIRLNQGFQYVVIMGDLNDTPTSDPLSPLLGNSSDLTDVMDLDKFEHDERVGTHGNGTAAGKLDYILLSPKLVELVERAGVERRGVWGGTNGTLFPHFPEIQSEKDAASDHASLWVDLNL
jgi:endonuclease/exonuclease/phosphatase family metal-dependent hydrolase